MPDSLRLARQTAITAGLLVMNNPSTVSYRKIWLMSYPLMISLIIEHMIGLTDAVFLGRVGDVALGACALGGVYYMAMFMLAFGFGFGAQIIIARRNGERRYNRIAPTMIQGCYFMLTLALLLFFTSRYLSPSILRHAIESPQVFGATMEYLHWRTYGVFFSFLCVMFRSYYVGITQTKILTVNSIVMLLSNVVLNYCLIFGKGGFPAMGVAGAAIASSVAEAVSLAFFIIYTGITADKRKYGFRKAFTFRPQLLKGMLSISGWTMVQSFISVSVWFIFFLAIEHLGERPLAVTNIVRNMAAMLIMVMSAFATTAGALISNQIGAGEQRFLFKTCGMTLNLTYALLIPLLIILCLFPEPILRIFTDNPSLIAASIPSVYVMATSTLISAPAFILFNAVSGTGNTRAGFVMEMITLAVYTVAVYYGVIVLKPDVALCWFSEHIYGLVLISLTWWYLKSGRWRGKKV